MRWAFLAAAALLACASTASAQASLVELDRVRVRAHLERVERALRAADVSRLTDEQRAMRARRLDDLHAYASRGIFPHGSPEQPTVLAPTFIDAGDRACAMAWLVIVSGHEDVAREIARDQNHAYVPDIRHPALAPWLEENGLTLAEAAAIQPSYCFALDAAIERALCACAEHSCQPPFAEDVGPLVCAVNAYVVTQCQADCADAEITGPAECDPSFMNCACTDGGVPPDDAAASFDAGTLDASTGPTAHASCACHAAAGGSPLRFWSLGMVLAAFVRTRWRSRRARRTQGRPWQR